ncbi:MAG: RHS repeat-associated core domain-containing protein, partial [Acidobacteriota bacterium]
RFCSPWTARFLSVDPLRSSARTKIPQTWNRYSYAFNNPVTLVDPDGQAGIKYFVNTVKGIYRRVTRAQAVRKAKTHPHAVRVQGAGASSKSKDVVKEAFPDKRIVRHQSSRRYQRNDRLRRRSFH